MHKFSLIPKKDYNDIILSRINQRQSQILMHSCIYYTYCTSIISDKSFDNWCKELVYLQKNYPKETQKSKYYERFIGFDGTTGFNLDYSDFLLKARWLIDYDKKHK